MHLPRSHASGPSSGAPLCAAATLVVQWLYFLRSVSILIGKQRPHDLRSLQKVIFDESLHVMLSFFISSQSKMLVKDVVHHLLCKNYIGIFCVPRRVLSLHRSVYSLSSQILKYCV